MYKAQLATAAGLVAFACSLAFIPSTIGEDNAIAISFALFGIVLIMMIIAALGMLAVSFFTRLRSITHSKDS